MQPTSVTQLSLPWGPRADALAEHVVHALRTVPCADTVPALAAVLDANEAAVAAALERLREAGMVVEEYDYWVAEGIQR
jgi:predicted transcriptional regulator